MGWIAARVSGELLAGDLSGLVASAPVRAFAGQAMGALVLGLGTAAILRAQSRAFGPAQAAVLLPSWLVGAALAPLDVPPFLGPVVAGLGTALALSSAVPRRRRSVLVAVVTCAWLSGWALAWLLEHAAGEPLSEAWEGTVYAVASAFVGGAALSWLLSWSRRRRDARAQLSQQARHA